MRIYCKCPHCAKRTGMYSWWNNRVEMKLQIGPSADIMCKSCNKESKVDLNEFYALVNPLVDLFFVFAIVTGIATSIYIFSINGPVAYDWTKMHRGLNHPVILFPIVTAFLSAFWFVWRRQVVDKVRRFNLHRV